MTADTMTAEERRARLGEAYRLILTFAAKRRAAQVADTTADTPPAAEVAQRG
jgi:hypothetical protein